MSASTSPRRVYLVCGIDWEQHDVDSVWADPEAAEARRVELAGPNPDPSRGTIWVIEIFETDKPEGRVE